MKPQTNYEIGRKGEERIVQELIRLGAHGICVQGHNSIPDVDFTLDGVKVYAELKTILTPHRGGRNGVAKMTATEFDAMEKLSNGCRVLIAECRPSGGFGRAYFAIPWKAVQILFHKRVAMKSLTFWWLLRNGVPLSLWKARRENG